MGRGSAWCLLQTWLVSKWGEVTARVLRGDDVHFRAKDVYQEDSRRRKQVPILRLGVGAGGLPVIPSRGRASDSMTYALPTSTIYRFERRLDLPARLKI